MKKQPLAVWGNSLLLNPSQQPCPGGGITDGDQIWINMLRARTGMSRGPSGLRWVGASAYQEPEVASGPSQSCSTGASITGPQTGAAQGATERRLRLWVHRWLGAPCRRPCSVQRGRLRQAYWGAGSSCAACPHPFFRKMCDSCPHPVVE